MRRAWSSPRAGSAPRTTTAPSRRSRKSPAWSSCSTRTCSSGSTAGPTRSPSATASTGPASTPGNRKQAHVPVGASVLGMAGTAPGLILPVDGSVVVVLPGVPSELRRLWEDAPEHRALADVFAARRAPGPLAACAPTASASRTSPTSTARPGATRRASRRRSAREASRSRSTSAPIRATRPPERRSQATMRAELGDYVFSTDERPLAEIVLDLLAGAGMDGGDGRVVHRRDGRRRAHRHRRELGRRSPGAWSPIRTRSSAICWGSPRASSRSTAP